MNTPSLLPPLEMSAEDLKNQLINWIEVQGSFLANDTRSYMLVKLLPISTSSAIGGGNMVVGTAAFPCLEFYSAIYCHLSDPGLIWVESDVRIFEEAKKVVQAAKILTSKQKDIAFRVRPRIGEMRDAATAVRRLLTAFESNTGIKSGLPISSKARFQTIWNAFRNHLMHRMTPQLGCSVGSLTKDQLMELGVSPELLVAGMHLEPNMPFHMKHVGTLVSWQCDSDVLALGYLPFVMQFLKEVVLDCGDHSRLASALSLVRGALFEDSPDKG